MPCKWFRVSLLFSVSPRSPNRPMRTLATVPTAGSVFRLMSPDLHADRRIRQLCAQCYHCCVVTFQRWVALGGLIPGHCLKAVSSAQHSHVAPRRSGVEERNSPGDAITHAVQVGGAGSQAGHLDQVLWRGGAAGTSKQIVSSCLHHYMHHCMHNDASVSNGHVRMTLLVQWGQTQKPAFQECQLRSTSAPTVCPRDSAPHGTT